MADGKDHEAATVAPDARLNVLAGIALGAFLVLLVGLSASPVVSIVLTALVGLLAGFFGLSDASPLRLGAQSLQRITALAGAGFLVLPFAVWVRTHDLLSPAVGEQQAIAREMGYADGTKEQRDLLSYLRFGYDAGSTATRPATPADKSVLYSGENQTLCDNLIQIHSVGDLTQLLITSNVAGAAPMTREIAKLSESDKAKAIVYAKIFLCHEG